MIHKILQQIPAFTAADHTILKEVLHPDNDGLALPYSLAQAYLEPGTRSKPHVLKSAELYIFRAGEGIIYVEGKAQEVKGGELVLVPGGAEQYVENTGAEALDFWLIVSPAWRAEEEEIF